MKRTTALAAGSLVTAGALGLALPALASADTDDAGTTTTPSLTQLQERRDDLHAELAEKLADELGLDTDTVSEALDTVMDQMRTEHRAERLDTLQQRLDQAVEDGTLTRKRADAIYDAVKDGFGPWLGGAGGRGPGGMGGMGPGGMGGMGPGGMGGFGRS